MFDLFPRLPCELRLEIWKFAIRPAGRGVHRFSLVDTHTDRGHHPPAPGRAAADADRGPEARHAAAAPRVLGRPGAGYSWTDGNDSAYLWDAGLWTACRESRGVMTWHFGVEHWNEARRRLLRSRGHWTPAALADEFEHVTAMATARDGAREWHLMLRPHRDLFWLEPRDWKSTVEWPTLFLDLPFASPRRGYGHLSHVAVEHDASWNVDLPKDLGTLLREPTPRGFIARAMAECAANKLYCFVWLVDRALVRRDPAEAAVSGHDDGDAEEGEELREGREVTELTELTELTEVTETTEDTGKRGKRADEDEDDDDDGDDGDEHNHEDDDDDDDDTPSSSDLMTFYDCGRVYVDTDRADLVPHKYDSAAEYEKTALHFVQLLGTIGNADYCLLGDDAGATDDFDFRVDEYLGVLACV